jgi:cytoskeleton protein RodZ
VESLGARLKREREQRKITLEEISLSTKIGTRFLLAIEEEQFDQLPGGIFNKGLPNTNLPSRLPFLKLSRQLA